jgi:hypothetical protein
MMNFMSLVFDGNIEATEFLLNTIFGRTDLKVIEVKLCARFWKIMEKSVRKKP